MRLVPGGLIDPVNNKHFGAGCEAFLVDCAGDEQRVAADFVNRFHLHFADTEGEFRDGKTE